jgi:hypothetical protein
MKIRVKPGVIVTIISSALKELNVFTEISTILNPFGVLHHLFSLSPGFTGGY